MAIDFIDIRIVSLEEEMMVESPNDRALFHIYLRLSQTPPPLWQHHFRESRKVSRHPHWRQAWLDRKYIVVECPVHEIETYHLNDLKQDIAHANRQYRSHLERQAALEHQKEKATHQEREKLRELKDRLNFD